MIDDIDLCHVGEPFELERFRAETADEKHRKRVASAIAVRSRILARRAKSEAHLADILPPQIADGESWHVLSSGDVDALSFLAHIIKSQPMEYVAFSTWCMAAADVAQLGAWLQSGAIDALDAYVGEIFPNQYPAEFESLCAIVRRNTGRVCVFRNHAKMFLCRAQDRAWVIESSANINTNPRTENTVITADRALFDHNLSYLHGIRSFDRSFDDWSPRR